MGVGGGVGVAFESVMEILSRFSSNLGPVHISQRFFSIWFRNVSQSYLCVSDSTYAALYMVRYYILYMINKCIDTHPQFRYMTHDIRYIIIL